MVRDIIHVITISVSVYIFVYVNSLYCPYTYLSIIVISKNKSVINKFLNICLSETNFD